MNSGACSATNTITVTRAETDLINGAATAVISTAYGFVAIESNGYNKWTIVDGASEGGVSTLNTLSGALSIVATDGNVVSAGGTTLTIGGPGGFVNRFRDGAMDVWQRGTSSLIATTSGAYTADGWIVLPSGASVTASQAAGRLLTKNSLEITGAASVTDVIVKQRIESLIAAVFCSQTVTVQAQIYNNTGGTITPTLTVKHAGSQDIWSSPTTDVSAESLSPAPTESGHRSPTRFQLRRSPIMAWRSVSTSATILVLEPRRFKSRNSISGSLLASQLD